MNSFHGIIDILHKSITEEKIITGNLEKQKQQQQKGNREDKKKNHTNTKTKANHQGYHPNLF